MGPWSKLPVDLLKIIEDHLVLYIDKVRIRAVCVAWNSYLPKLPNHQVKQLLWLMHPLKNNTEASHGLFNPIDEKIYKIYLPEARGKMFKGSSYGWIVTVEDIHSISPTDIYLINPLTRAQIKLPQRTKFADVVKYRPDEVDEEFIVRRCYDVPNDYQFVEDFIDEMSLSSYDVSLALLRKVVLSSAPCDECVVVSIYGQACQLAWCRCNDETWTHIYTGISCFVDIIFHKSKLYALTDIGELFMIENIESGLGTKVTKIASGVPIPKGRGGYLAVCSDGSLVLVGRYFENDKNRKQYLVRTIGFKVYKFDSGNSSWVEVKNIGNDILFVGYNSARSISSHDLSRCKKNHIYFSDSVRLSSNVDENENSDSDIGIFSLKDETLESLPGLQQPIWPRPIWINVI
ncbi:hypothetical protein LguiA_013964 [Lonicera macranthoides]